MSTGIDIRALGFEEKIRLLESAEDIAQPEFRAAVVVADEALERDLRGGVAVSSGLLASSIRAVLTHSKGLESSSTLRPTARRKSYPYPARLDQDGSLKWRSGRYRGRRTWGWFSWTAPKLARKFFPRELYKAIERVVARLSR